MTDDPKDVDEMIDFLQRQMLRSPYNSMSLARAAGLGSDTVARWFAGSRRPKTDQMDAALRVLGFRLAIAPLTGDDARPEPSRKW